MNTTQVKDEQNAHVPKIPNEEWDECVKNAVTNVGAGLITGAVLGTLVGTDLPIIWGTVVSICWSLHTCRSLMRDGIITPEMRRAMKEEERMRNEAERRRIMEERECCRKVKELEEKLRQITSESGKLADDKSSRVEERPEDVVPASDDDECLADEDCDPEEDIEDNEPCDPLISSDGALANEESEIEYCEDTEDDEEGDLIETSTGIENEDIEEEEDEETEYCEEDEEYVDVSTEQQTNEEIPLMEHSTTNRLNHVNLSHNHVVPGESTKPETWPFSFSLPSLDKFQTKSASNFKWPPLPSSIIVKPKKRQTSTDGENVKPSEQNCTCNPPKTT